MKTIKNIFNFLKGDFDIIYFLPWLGAWSLIIAVVVTTIVGLTIGFPETCNCK